MESQALSDADPVRDCHLASSDGSLEKPQNRHLANSWSNSTRPWWSLRRSISKDRRYVPVIDGLRFVAITFVVLYHLNDYLVTKTNAWTRDELRSIPLFKLIHLGSCGVPLFFAISGFILSLPFLRKRHLGERFDLKSYYLRRLTRLEPPYLFNLALIFCLLVWVNGQTVSELWPHLLASVFYLHNQIYGAMSEINFVAWSLEIEVQFYLLMPLIAWCCFRKQGRARRTILWSALILVVTLKCLFAQHAPPRLKLSLPYMLDHFIVGILLADMYYHDWKQEPKRSFGFDLLGLVGWVGLIATQMSPQTRHLFPLPMLLAYIGSMRGKALQGMLSFGSIPIIGGMCYTIYLYHFYVISFAGRFVLGMLPTDSYVWSIAGLAAIVLPTIVITSSLLFKLFEQPFMSWRPWSDPPRLVDS